MSHQPFGVKEAKALAQSAHRDADVCRGMVASVLQDAGRGSRHAAWTLTHLPPEDMPALADRRSDLVRLALTTADTSLCRLVLSLLERMGWPLEEVRPDLLDFCLLHLSSPDAPYGVRSLCVKLAWHQCRHYAELRAELRQTLASLDPATLGPGLRCTVKKTLKRLSAN